MDACEGGGSDAALNNNCIDKETSLAHLILSMEQGANRVKEHCDNLKHALKVTDEFEATAGAWKAFAVDVSMASGGAQTK